ncbi:cell envelope integrity protein TolA [Vibrio navarrensis]|uniref:cell envelope integrity protein TolA n=1 Tax=Vibrio navarrensis TaxID=29495 RepID=UPI00186A91ED|nr:cell envelope integrity protein TolA [Vibrio navarrensis]MBE4617275.1 protein TolA [Vibrio navarrensis]
MREKKNKKNDFVVPIVVSLLLHVVLVVALLWSTDFNMPKPQASGQMVQAVVIDPKLVQQQANEIRQQREKAAKKEQERLDKLRREAEQLEKNRKAEEEQLRKLKEQQVRDAKAAREAEEARKKREQEQKVAEEKVRQEKDRAAKLEAERKLKEEAIKKAEQERVAKEAAAAKAEQERLANEKAAREAEEKALREREAAKKAEQERIAQQKAAAEAAEKARKEKARLQQLEKERKEKQAALNDIFSGLETEASHNNAAKSQFVTDEKNRYGQIYQQLIQQKLIKDEYLLGKSCRVNITLIPTGVDAIVSSVSVLEGDSRVCTAAKSAIAQVGNFPMPEDEAVRKELRTINLTVALE